MQTKDLVYIALFAALMAVLGIFPPINIPAIGVPITAQSMGVMLAGALAGAKRGSLAIVLFLVLVAIGLPLLAGGRGGFGLFLTPTGGFLVGFVLGAALIGVLFARHKGAVSPAIAFVYMILGGIVVVHVPGILWWSYVTETPLLAVLATDMAFIPGDLIKAVLATVIVTGVRKAYPQL